MARCSVQYSVEGSHGVLPKNALHLVDFVAAINRVNLQLVDLEDRALSLWLHVHICLGDVLLDHRGNFETLNVHDLRVLCRTDLFDGHAIN